MFKCQLTGEQSIPREKPVFVVISQRRRTNGSQEIEREARVRLVAVDPDMAKRLSTSRRPPDFGFYATLSAPRFEHARKCKKSLDECPHCRSNVEFFANLPLPILTALTEEKRFKAK